MEVVDGFGGWGAWSEVGDAYQDFGLQHLVDEVVDVGLADVETVGEVVLKLVLQGLAVEGVDVLIGEIYVVLCAELVEGGELIVLHHVLVGHTQEAF